MSQNPILDEIYEAREKILKENQDFAAYVESARQRALQSGHPIAAPIVRTRRGKKVAESTDPSSK